MNFSLGFSPCPNDTFIFYALLNHKIDTQGLNFTPVITDVEALNRKAFNSEIDITKVSFATFRYLQNTYQLLNSGSALGNNCGPLVISKRQIKPDEIKTCTVAIPGKHTTANFLFNTFFPVHGEKKEMVFSEIEDTVLNDKTDVGVIIHESRFTYQKKGLQKVVDLGMLWEQATQHPLPLGGIIARKDLGAKTIRTVDQLIRASVLYAFDHREETMSFVKSYSQEMEDEVINQHINLYVNNFTIDLGEAGRAAVERFLGK